MINYTIVHLMLFNDKEIKFHTIAFVCRLTAIHLKSDSHANVNTLIFSHFIILLLFAFLGMLKTISFVVSTTVCLHSHFDVRCHSNNIKYTLYIVIHCNYDYRSVVQLKILWNYYYSSNMRESGNNWTNKQQSDQEKQPKDTRDKSNVAYRVWNMGYGIRNTLYA